MITEIQVGTENGSAYGYVAQAGAINIQNYLETFTPHAKRIATFLANKGITVALLRHMMVDEDFRGQGEGNELVSRFLEKADCHEAMVTMLLCDQYESQEQGFDLKRFYESFGMVESIQTEHGPLMFNDEDIAEAVRKCTLKRSSELTIEM